MKSQTYSFPGEEFSIYYLIATESDSIMDRVDFNLLCPKNELFFKAEFLHTFDRFAYFLFTSEKDTIIHIPNTSNLHGMFQKLIEIVQIEIREELRENTTYRNSFFRFIDVEMVV